MSRTLGDRNKFIPLHVVFDSLRCSSCRQRPAGPPRPKTIDVVHGNAKHPVVQVLNFEFFLSSVTTLKGCHPPGTRLILEVITRTCRRVSDSSSIGTRRNLDRRSSTAAVLQQYVVRTTQDTPTQQQTSHEHGGT